MKVKEAIGLLAYGTPYEVRGAYSGKVYHRNTNSSKNLDKYADREVTDTPFYVSMRVDKDVGIASYCRPIVGIWMHDYDLAKENEIC